MDSKQFFLNQKPTTKKKEPTTTSKCITQTHSTSH